MNRRFKFSNKNKRKKHPFLCLGIIAIFLVLSGYAAYSVNQSVAHHRYGNEEVQNILSRAASVFIKSAPITVDGVEIQNLTYEEARLLLSEHFHWSMTVRLAGNNIYPIRNLLTDPLEMLLQEIYQSGEPAEYTLDLSGLEPMLKAEITRIADSWDNIPQNSEIIAFDQTSGNFTFRESHSGLIIDQDSMFRLLWEAVQAKNFQAELSPEIIETKPLLTTEQARAAYQVIGTHTTNTTNNTARNTNIQLAIDAINGVIVESGEEFSFNQATGNRTTEKGYQPAGAYQNGILIEEPGGGVCQVSTTLYNAVVFSGLRTTERNSHSFIPSYVTPGEDAMVSYDGFQGPDMKFINNSASAVAIRAELKNQQLTVFIFGIPLLPEGTTISMHSQKVRDTAPPYPEFIEDRTLNPGGAAVKIPSQSGSVWTTNLQVIRRGEVISDRYFHRSIYNGKPATIAVYLLPATPGNATTSDAPSLPETNTPLPNQR